ncbi:MAG: PmoA family protein, partial [Planctomycetia bacterium]|nr:PmoA family protein [Planctomycetia bacterium]
RVDGAERLGYEFGTGKSRPIFYPVVGASGAVLTRLGHPNPVGHEHHKSVWFGHQKVNGVNFWEDRENSDVRVRHRRVTLYQDGEDSGGMVADLDWWAQGRSVMRQTLIVVIEPQGGHDLAIDFQTRFQSEAGPVELGKTNFGFLGVRVAKTISEQFGGGRLRNEHGDRGEPAIFGKTSRWVDYSGPSRADTVEGVCYMDHPDNPHHPSPWHVRRDGWMESAFNLAAPHGVAKDHPLDLRYRLLIHDGEPPLESLNRAWERFAANRPYAVRKDPGAALATLKRVTD